MKGDLFRVFGPLLLGVGFGAMFTVAARAEDWPEWRGRDRLGVWRETDLVKTFPDEGLPQRWSTEIFAGYAGPSVAAGRVFVTDYRKTGRARGEERGLCLDEVTGKILWSRSWPVRYGGMQYAYGPRATPTVDGDRVIFLGAMGNLVCCKVIDGELLWQRDFVEEYGTEVPVWGISGAPLVDGSRVVCLVGGTENAKVVAFDRETGEEVWRALPDDSEPGYSAPILFEVSGRKQLVIWHPKAVHGLDPVEGKSLWEVPFSVRMGLSVATPVRRGSRLFVSAFFDGPLMMEWNSEGVAKRVWKGKSTSEIQTDGLHCLINTPVLDGDLVFGVGSYGELRCLDAKTGERLWETLAATEKARWASAFLIRNGDRYLINNDRGDLIAARLTREGYEEISRTVLIEPTTRGGGRREKKLVNWTHPAFANGHVLTRNDGEIVSFSLLAEN